MQILLERVILLINEWTIANPREAVNCGDPVGIRSQELEPVAMATFLVDRCLVRNCGLCFFISLLLLFFLPPFFCEG